MTQRRLAGIFITMALVAAAPVMGAQKPHQWKTGKLVNAEAGTRTEQSGIGPDYGFPGGVRVRHSTLKDTRITVQGDEFLYVAQETVEPGGFLARKGCHYIVNDAIQYAKDKDRLYVRDGDGRECRLLILREERVKPQ